VRKKEKEEVSLDDSSHISKSYSQMLAAIYPEAITQRRITQSFVWAVLTPTWIDGRSIAARCNS